MDEQGLVSVVVVTYNSARVIRACLESVAGQSCAPAELIVIDNASTDGTEAAVRVVGTPMRFVKNATNTGFAAAHNQGIRLTRGKYYFALNPDVVMAPSFLEAMVGAAELHPEVGSLTGKLFRLTDGTADTLIDSAGIYMTPSLRHLDRGSGRKDCGEYERTEYVFGASGAAALYRREMLEDVAVEGEYFDEDFFAYREDADLAWRAQLRGWKALYVPAGVAAHERRVLPERRSSLPPEINMHSVKNRFLLRIKNQTAVDFAALLLPSLLRDAQVLGYVLLREQSSLPGLLFVARNLRRVWAKRKSIMSRRRVGGSTILRWFWRRAQPLAAAASRA